MGGKHQKSQQAVSSLPADVLGAGEVKVLAVVGLDLNRGHLKIKPGTEVILGPEDFASGVNLKNLVKCGAVRIIEEGLKA
jgi:hypothetical protein